MAAQPSRCLRQKQARRSRGSRPNMQAGGDPRCIFGQRQPGAALQFSQGRSAARRENWLSARGTRSAFCKRATSRAAKTGHRNPGGLDDKSKAQQFLAAKSPLCLSVEGAVCAQSPAGAAAATASSGRSRKPPLAQRSEYASVSPDAPHIQGTARGTPSKYASGRRPALHIWSTATRRSAPIFTRAHRRPPRKLAKRKRKPAGPGEMPPRLRRG